MFGANIHTAQTRGDDVPVQRIKEMTKCTNPKEGKLAADDNSSSRNSNATSLKMLLAKEMATEVESKRRPPSVIARLMGLEEDRPTEEPIVDHVKSEFKERDLKATNKVLEQLEQHKCIRLMTRDIHHSLDKTTEYNDVFEVCEERSGTSYFHDRTSQKGCTSENKCDQLDTAQEKVPSSNKDLFLEPAEDCNSTFSRHLSGLHTYRALPETKRITVLRPIRSVEINGVRQSGAEQVNEQNVLKLTKFCKSQSSKEEIPSQPSRIVILRPTPGKPGISKAKLTARDTSFQLINRNNPNGSLDDNGATRGSARLVHGIMQHPQDGCHQRDDSLLSSTYSNGYGGDESSFSDSEIDRNSDSEIDYIEEDGRSFSESDGGSPLSKRSWYCHRRNEGPSSGSSFSNTLHVPESSVIREAKKQLSERWAMVACDDISQEQGQSSRRTCTLGEMLSIQVTKKEDFTTGMLSVYSNQSCGMENELTRSMYVTTPRKSDQNEYRSPGKLLRSNSVPVIPSMYDNKVANMQASNPESCKPKVVVVSNKGKTSFKGRVSDFFLSRSKKSKWQKSTYRPSGCFAERVEAGIVHSEPDYKHNPDELNLDTNGKAVHCGDKIDKFTLRISTGVSERTASMGAPISLDCPSGNLYKLGANKGLNSNRDQPSPTSVFDAPSEYSSCNEPETSGRTTSKIAISRSSAIEAVACSLSWNDAVSESHCTPRPPSLLSDVDDDESEYHVLVQNIMSSAGFGGAQSSTVFTGWHLPDHPLDPVLCNKVFELQEQSSYRRLLFDCVNVALIEIGENALLSAFPCSRPHSRAWRDTSSPDLGVKVWSILKDWIYGARMFVVSKRDNAGIMLDKIVKQEIEGGGWVKLVMLQVVDITEQVEGGVMEELVEEAVLDLATCFQQ
ncbi:hypothetical protein ACP70R_026654 [Stipagrostis hirtigluma subsp. patula]